jgi:hypothetical protein
LLFFCGRRRACPAYRQPRPGRPPVVEPGYRHRWGDPLQTAGHHSRQHHALIDYSFFLFWPP